MNVFGKTAWMAVFLIISVCMAGEELAASKNAPVLSPRQVVEQWLKIYPA